MQAHPLISVIIPSYRCESCLVELHGRLSRCLERLTSAYEIVIVNDGSPQADWAVIRQLASLDPRVKGVNLSRNFGQHYALTAGLEYATGDWIVAMDADLQDPPEEIAKLYSKALEGYDVVFGRKPTRQHGVTKRIASRAFTRLLGFLTNSRLDNAVTHFSIISREVARNVLRLEDRHRSYAFLIQWLGFHVGYVDVRHDSRYAGSGSYTVPKLLALGFDLIVSQSDLPLRLAMAFGFVVAFFAFCYGGYEICRYFFWGYPVTGWTSLIVSFYFLGGLLFVAIGIQGLYVARIFNETKRRPLYVVKDTINIAQRTSGICEQRERLTYE